MSGFSAEWLALRESADMAARSDVVTRAVVEALSRRTPARIVDLGSGAGSNVRFLSSRLRVTHEWLLVDDDPHLLDIAARSSAAPVETRVHDLRALDPVLFQSRTLVTASALLDLVSDVWLAELVRHCRQAGAHALFALNYDGRMTCTPEDDADALVRAAVNEHQRGDKGFGPALGPSAGVRAAHWLAAAGYRVLREPSDWVLDASHAELQRQLIAGWAQAASELRPMEASRISAWCTRRLAHVDGGTSTIIVGHDDVAGVLDG